MQVLSGRPAVFWWQGTHKVNLTDFCEDARDDVASIIDTRAEWSDVAANALLELGLQCTQSGRQGVKQRPSVLQCIDTLTDMMELPLSMLALPPVTQQECVVCLEAPRGRHRFIPCAWLWLSVIVAHGDCMPGVGEHSVCCGGCAKAVAKRGTGCVICKQPIQSVQEI